MRKHTCHLDHHQRSRYVTIGLKGKLHWVLQLINNHEEKFLDKQNSSNQPNQFQNCSRRNPKRSAKYVYHIGTLALSTAHAGTSYAKEVRKIRNS